MKSVVLFRKIFIFLALISSLIIGVFIYQTNFQNIAPSDSYAYGFGDEVNRSMFEPISELFLNSYCNYILDKKNVDLSNHPHVDSYKLLISEQLVPLDNIPLRCRWYIEDGKEIEFEIYAYDLTSPIDATMEDWHSRINNSNLKTIKEQSRIGIIDFYRGKDLEDPSECRTNFFHPTNDFEYGTILYKGFNCDQIESLNDELVDIFGNYTVLLLDSAYRSYGGFTTGELLGQLGYIEYAEGLGRYFN